MSNIVGWRRPGTKNHKWAGPESPTWGFVLETTAFVHNCSRCDHHDLLQHHRACICNTDMCRGKLVPGQKYSQMVIVLWVKRPCFLSGPWLRRSGPSKIDSSKWVVSSPHCIDASFVIECYGVPHHRIVTSWFAFCSATVLLTCWGGVHQFFTMDAILRLLEGLRRDELVWLNTYLTGRLRALPLPATATTPVQLPSTPPCGELPAAALAERVGDLNLSMDPWERTGAAPQGWA